MEPSPHPLPEGEGCVIPGGCKSPLPTISALHGRNFPDPWALTGNCAAHSSTMPPQELV